MPVCQQPVSLLTSHQALSLIILCATIIHDALIVGNDKFLNISSITAQHFPENHFRHLRFIDEYVALTYYTARSDATRKRTSVKDAHFIITSNFIMTT